jgi:hypothetical protein
VPQTGRHAPHARYPFKEVKVMKAIAIVSAFVMTLGCMPGAWAQGQPSPPSGQTQSPAERPARPPARGPRTMGPGMMEHHDMTEMMCPMMVGMMMGRLMNQGGGGRGMPGSGMMGMGGGMMQGANPSDPKAMARMLRFRGDMRWAK